ncbi:MAG: hydrogenase maturation protease [Candidatus Humimicrobiaceae bacterium]
MNKNKIKSDNSKGRCSISKPVKIIGFGNIFMSDDGIGVKIIEELGRVNFCTDFKNIEIIDGATSGIDLLFTLSNLDKVIIIDALDAGQADGEVVKFKLNDIADMSGKKIKSFSLHDLSLDEVFNLMKSLKICPDITIIGIKPKIIEYGDKLSPELECKIPEIILMIKQEISKYKSE